MQMIDAAAEAWGQGLIMYAAAPSVANDPGVRESAGRDERLAASPAMARAVSLLNLDIDVREILSSIAVPTLVLHRTNDRFIPVELGRFLAEGIPGAKLVELAGEDHAPWIGDVESLVGEIEEFVTGTRQAPEPDRVLATVLFTDIVGSTQRAASLGDAQWRDVLGRHDALVRRSLELHRGREIKSVGDGFLATFEGPARAIRCAQSIARSVRDIGLDIRAGLHTGELELGEHDARGIAVHIGARVLGIAGAGEVLVSSTVKDLVAGSGTTFEERGTHQLKGVPGEWRLFAVTSA